MESNLKLRIRNTGKLMSVDEQDWDLVKDIQWFEYKGMICTQKGVKYEDICSFPEKTKNRHDDIYDKRRNMLIDENKRWIFSEYHGKFISEC